MRDFDVPGTTVTAQRSAVPLRFASVKSKHKGWQTPQLSFIGGVRGERVVKAITIVFSNRMQVQMNLREELCGDVNRLYLWRRQYSVRG